MIKLSKIFVPYFALIVTLVFGIHHYFLKDKFVNEKIALCQFYEVASYFNSKFNEDAAYTNDGKGLLSLPTHLISDSCKEPLMVKDGIFFDVLGRKIEYHFVSSGEFILTRATRKSFLLKRKETLERLVFRNGKLVFDDTVVAKGAMKYIDKPNVDLVMVDKSERVMYLMNEDTVIKQYPISLGAQPKGHKQQEGDERTPEGIYTLDYINENSSFYRSMHINYPNASDKALAEKKGVSPGGFIMVHGQRNGFGWLSRWMQKRDWTDGCIAITNDEMDEFLELVSVGTKINIQW